MDLQAAGDVLFAYAAGDGHGAEAVDGVLALEDRAWRVRRNAGSEWEARQAMLRLAEDAELPELIRRALRVLGSGRGEVAQPPQGGAL